MKCVRSVQQILLHHYQEVDDEVARVHAACKSRYTVLLDRRPPAGPGAAWVGDELDVAYTLSQRMAGPWVPMANTIAYFVDRAGHAAIGNFFRDNYHIEGVTLSLLVVAGYTFNQA